MSSNISDTNSFDFLLAELRGLRDGMDKVHARLNMHTRITEARLGEFRAELERINSSTRSGIQDFKYGMQAELVTVSESLRDGVRADLDAVKVQVSSDVDVVKAAVLTSQAQVSGLAKQISAFNTTSRVTKKRRIKSEPSESACAEQKDGLTVSGRRRPNASSRIVGGGEVLPHIKLEPLSVQLEMIQPEKPIPYEKSEKKIVDFSAPDDNTETRRIGTYDMTNRVNKKLQIESEVSGSACDDQEDQARSQDIVSKRKQSMQDDGLKTDVLSVEVEFADGTVDFERGKSSGRETSNTSKMFEEKIGNSPKALIVPMELDYDKPLPASSSSSTRDKKDIVPRSQLISDMPTSAHAEGKPHTKAEPCSLQLKMIEPEKPISDEKSEKKLADFPASDGNVEAKRSVEGLLTKRGGLSKCGDKFALYPVRFGMCAIDVDRGVPMNQMNGEAWAVIDAHNWSMKNYGAFSTQRLAEARLEEVTKASNIALKVVRVELAQMM